MTGKPDIQRLIGDIVRIGTIASVDLGAQRCTLDIGDLTTGPLPWATPRAGKVRIWSPPAVGEQCILLCAEGDSNAGIVIPAIFCDAFAAPSSSADEVVIAFDDDTILRYDTAAHHLGITIGGSGTVSIDAPGGVTINGPLTVNDDVTVNGTLTASTDVIGGSKSLKSHKHSGVQAGGAQTGAPV